MFYFAAASGAVVALVLHRARDIPDTLEQESQFRIMYKSETQTESWVPLIMSAWQLLPCSGPWCRTKSRGGIFRVVHRIRAEPPITYDAELRSKSDNRYSKYNCLPDPIILSMNVL